MKPVRVHSVVALSLVAVLTAVWAPSAWADEFGDFGVGTNVLIVDGDGGSETGFGFELRWRFLYVLGVDFSAAHIEESEQVWGPSAYRADLSLHAVRTENFELYIAPGLAADDIGDAFNPTGRTTWYRLGGGTEVRVDGFALGLEMHWTIPGEEEIRGYVEENQEALVSEYLAGLGYDGTEVPPNYEDLIKEASPYDLLDMLPLDRLEVAVAMRYYF